MNRKAIIYVETDRMLDGVCISLVKISGVPLLLRLLIDARRAGFQEVSVVFDKPHAQLERMAARHSPAARILHSANDGWRAPLLQDAAVGAVILLADRLYDFRILAALRESPLGAHDSILAVDLSPGEKIHEAEQRFTPYSGTLTGELASDARPISVGAYVCNRTSLSQALGLFSRMSVFAAFEEATRRNAKLFDIDNGFAQTIESRADLKQAEQRIIRYIWKDTDGIHARLNKKIALPIIKLVLKTPLTPNMISLAGVLVSLAAGYCFWQGTYLFTVAGALLSYISSLFDHVDGSIARLKSLESAFGCYLEQVCDFAFYFSLAIGLTGGLYNSTGNSVYLGLGGAFVFGILTSLFTLTYQRKEFADDPSKFASKAHRTFEAQKRNPVYRFGRTTYFITKRPVLPYYLFIFTVLNLLPVVLFLAALASNLFWIIQLLSNRIFRPSTESVLGK